LSEDFLKRVWAQREEHIYPELFGELGAGIFTLHEDPFENVFQKSPDPRWLFTGVFESPPSSKHDDWIYVSSGLSNPWEQEAHSKSTDNFSWLGVEFLFRVKQQGNWAIKLVQRIAAFEILLAHDRYEGRERLGFGDRVPIGGSIIPGGESVITHLLIAPPASPSPESFHLDSGRVEFVQLVGISEREAAFGRENGIESLTELLSEKGAYVTTDPHRKSIL
jgi:hypothetical protein